MGRHSRNSHETSPVEYSFPRPLPVNEEEGYVPQETGFDRGLEVTKKWGIRGVAVTAAGSAALLAALYWDMQRPDPFVPFVKDPEPRAAAPISPSPSPSPSPTHTMPILRSPSASPSPTHEKVVAKKTKPSPSPSPSESSSPSPSASITESPSPVASASPEYTCNAGPNLVVCEPSDSTALMSTYPYPDTRRHAEYTLKPGQAFDAECQLVSPTQGGHWILGTDGSYAQQAIFGADVSGVPQCDMR